MGRKGDFAEKEKSGPGRKAKKQKPPTFPAELRLKEGTDGKKLSSRQKQRAKKRELKKADKKKTPVKETRQEEEEEMTDDEGIDEFECGEMEDSDEETGVTAEFTDDNAAWLKPSSKRKLIEGSDDEEEEAQLAGGDCDDDQDGSGDSEEDDSDDDVGEGGEELQVERAARRLQAKQDRLRAEDEAELKTNLAEQEKFTLPSGQVGQPHCAL